MLRNLTLAAIGLSLSAPAYAQDTLPIDCLMTTQDTALAHDVVGDNLSNSGFTPTDPEVSARLNSAFEGCIAAHGVDEATANIFLNANYAYMVAEELRRRMIEVGLDMAPVEELVTAYLADQQLEVGPYIDSRPDEFAIPMAAAADAHGLEDGVMILMLADYISARWRQRANVELLSGQ